MQKLARLTGLSPSVLEENDLRIDLQTFRQELLRKEGKIVGRLDSRFTATNRTGETQPGIAADPSYAAIYGAYTAMLNDWVRTQLKYENDLPYEILTSRVRPWSYASYQNQYVNVAETLRGAIVQNPYLKVFVGAGYYDFATPYFAAEDVVAHLNLPDSLRANIEHAYYEAGHMMYIHEPSRLQQSADLAAFVTRSSARE